jgi:hypothetical protein
MTEHLRLSRVLGQCAESQNRRIFVIPAQAGIQSSLSWTPAFAGVTY